MMLTYNQKIFSLVDYEEAQIVYSLRKDHLMGQQEIAGLLSRSISWVSRRLTLMEKLEEKGYRGKMTILRDYLAGVRGKKQPEPIECIETSPGQRASHDWSDYFVHLADQAEVEQVSFFSCILHYSRYQYVSLVEDKTRLTLMQALVDAFIYFDGVPRQIKSDNQKACVDRWKLGKPAFNKEFLSFATHYCFRPLAIHPGRPREKLKVERPFYYLETNFLNARTFRNKADLKTHRIIPGRTSLFTGPAGQTV